MVSSLYDLVLGGSTAEQRAMIWRVLVTIVVVTHVAYASGWFPGVNAGFATIHDVSEIKQTVAGIQKNQLIEAIERERRNVCRNLQENNRAALDYSVRKRDELIRAYKELTGKDVEPVSCRELGIANEDRHS